MTIVARDLEQEQRRAWGEYAESTRDLHGTAYDQAEQDAWTRLQETLGSLGAEDAARAEPRVG